MIPGRLLLIIFIIILIPYLLRVTPQSITPKRYSKKRMYVFLVMVVLSLLFIIKRMV